MQKILISIMLFFSLCAFAQENVVGNEADTTVVKTYKDSIVRTCDEMIDENLIVVVPDSMPEFPGGKEAMNRFINKHKYYPPPIAITYERTNFRVICQFVVEKDGSITNIVVIRGDEPFLNKDAVRVIQKMPKWKPAQCGGQPVRCRYLLPIRYRLI